MQTPPPVRGVARSTVSSPLPSTPSHALMASLLLAPAGAPICFDEESTSTTPTRIEPGVAHHTHTKSHSLLHSSLSRRLASAFGASDHLLDAPLDPYVVDCDEVSAQVWSFQQRRRDGEAKSIKSTMTPNTPTIRIGTPSERRENVISPSRKQQAAESAMKAKLQSPLTTPQQHATHLSPSFSYLNIDSTPASDVGALVSNSVPVGGLTLLDSPTGSVGVGVGVTQAASKPSTPFDHAIDEDGNLERTEIVKDEKVMSVTADPWFATRQARKAANVSTALGLLSGSPDGFMRRLQQPPSQLPPPPLSNFPSAASIVASLHGAAEATLEREYRRKEEEARTMDLRKSIGQAQYMKLVLRHVRTRLIQEGRFVEDTSSSSSSHGATQDLGDPLINEWQAHLAVQRRDQWKGDVGSRQNSASTTRTTLQTSTSVDRLPSVSQIDIHKEITGQSRPLTAKSSAPNSRLNSRLGQRAHGSPTSSPSLSSLSSPRFGSLSPTLRGRTPTVTSHARARKLRGGGYDDQFGDMTFHIDPLDPIRPENACKSYKLALDLDLHDLREWPLDSRGPDGTWQELTDEEEIQAYNKILWLCEIKALAHVPLDGMLELILVMVERAYDVEVLLRAGEPGDKLYFVKTGEVQLKMERRIVEEMEERRILEALVSGGFEPLDDIQNYSLKSHPHPQTPAAHAFGGSSMPLLPTDPELVHKHVEIAKLGPFGICGEDILISPTRRYTLISLTPVWLYEIKVDALLRCFQPEARHNFLIAIAHTQRVRERHALVKSRTRLQYHAQPTMFRHFIDDGLKRKLARSGKRVDHDDPNAPLHKNGGGPPSIIFRGGGPDALRAVLQDLNHISSNSKHKYVRQSDERIEELVAHAALTKDRTTIAQRDMMKERQKSEARGGIMITRARSPTKPNSPTRQQQPQQRPQPQQQQLEEKQEDVFHAPLIDESIPNNGFTSPAPSTKHNLSQSAPGGTRHRGDSAQTPISPPGVGEPLHTRFGPLAQRVPATTAAASRRRSSIIGTGISLEERLTQTLAETVAMKRAQDEAALVAASLGVATHQLHATPASIIAIHAAKSLSGTLDERQAFLSDVLRAEREKAAAHALQLKQQQHLQQQQLQQALPSISSPPQSHASPEHRRRISSFVTGSGQNMYDSPFGGGANTSAGSIAGAISIVSPVASTGVARSTHSSRSNLATPDLGERKLLSPSTGQRERSNSPSKSPPSVGPTSPTGSHSFDSPFSMRFSESAVFEKSTINARPGVILFNASKQHVKRHTVAPLRTQTSAMIVLGEQPEEQTYGDLLPTSPNAAAARRRNKEHAATTAHGSAHAHANARSHRPLHEALHVTPDLELTPTTLPTTTRR